MTKKWRLIKDPPLPGGTNMKRDLEIMEQVAVRDSPPTLRLYRWDPPAVSLGYSQRAEKVLDLAACRRHGVDVIRRPTGGRALLHHREITYSLVVPENHSLIPAGVVDAYCFLSRGLVSALETLGLNPQVAPERPGDCQVLPGSCFDTPSAYELQVDQKKIVGSAQLRRRGVLLQHGSILLELCPELNREIFCLPQGDGNHPGYSLQERAAGLWDLGVTTGEEDLMLALQEGFASLFQVSFVKEAKRGESLTW